MTDSANRGGGARPAPAGTATTGTAPAERDAAAALAASPVFRRCSAADLQALAAVARWVELAPGDDLVREGDAPAELYVVQRGTALVLKRGGAGDLHRLSRLGPGESIGEMALFDRVPRSATVRAETPLRALALRLDDLLRHAAQRPALVAMLVDVGALVAERLRSASEAAAASADRALAESRTRAVMGRFTLLLMLAYTLYTWVLGTAVEVKQALGRSEFVTVPAIVACCAILFVFVRVSGYPPRFFGLTLERAGAHVREALVLTLPMLGAVLLLKLALLAWVPSMHGQPLLQLAAPAPPGGRGAELALAAAYVVFAPFQELIYRGGVQGPLAHFLEGRRRDVLANLGANVIFSSAHLYVSPGLAVAAFFAGVFWGWLYARQRSLVGVSVSHVVLGLFAFEVVGLGVLA